MKMPPDEDLLRKYRSAHCEEAFRMLVQQNVELVHTSAFRLTKNREFARDISQQVFSRLAARPESVPKSLLQAWLHKTTHSFSVSLIRSEERRRKREKIAMSLIDMTGEVEDWEAIGPTIENALNSLSDTDRSALLLRFYQKKSHIEVGVSLGLSEDATRMRIKRSLEKMRKQLSKYGITTTTAALATALPAHASVSPPTDIANSITQTALTNAPAALSPPALMTIFMKAKTIYLPIVCVSLLGLPLWQQTTIAALQEKQEKLITYSPESSARRTQHSSAAHRSTDSLIQAAINLASIHDPMERELALTKWSEQLQSSEEILSIIDQLEQAPGLVPRQHRRIAIHLTRRWATIDPDACIAAFLEAGKEGHNPLKAPPLDELETGGYFAYVAIENLGALQNWAQSASPEQFTPLFDSGIDPAFGGPPHYNLARSSDAILSTLARFYPKLLVDIVSAHPDEPKMNRLLLKDDLYPSLRAGVARPEDLWPLVADLPDIKNRGILYRQIAKEAFSSGSRPFGDIVDEISERDDGPRLASELHVLSWGLKKRFDQLQIGTEGADSPVGQILWDDVSSLASIVNSAAKSDDLTFDGIRNQVATLAARGGDRKGALQWVDSLVGPKSRVEAALDVAQILVSKDQSQNSKAEPEFQYFEIRNNPNSDQESNWVVAQHQNTSGILSVRHFSEVELDSNMTASELVDGIEGLLKSLLSPLRETQN